MYNKRENAASVSGETLSNEAVQNIASVYSETNKTIITTNKILFNL